MKRLILAIAFLSGCIPTENGRKPVPQPDANQASNEVVHVIKIVVTQEGESRVFVTGDGTISVRSNASESTDCECGCGKSGCACSETRDPVSNGASPVRTGGNDESAVNDRSAGGVFNKPLKTSRDIFVLSVDGCGACVLAAADMRRLGFDVHVVYDQQARQYPTIKNRRGDVYEIDDGYWNTGDDDIRAAKKLGQ